LSVAFSTIAHSTPENATVEPIGQVEVARRETEHHRARDHPDLRDRQREAEHVVDREEVIDRQRHRDEHHREDRDQAVFGEVLPPLLAIALLRHQRVGRRLHGCAREVFPTCMVVSPAASRGPCRA
jgi:hypothetical protein